MDTPRWRRYLRLARPDAVADVEDELSFHMEMRVAEYVRNGMSPEDARQHALERFGDVHAVRGTLVEHDRAVEQRERRHELLADLAQDIRFGWRSLRRAPAFTVAAVITLALGIGANTAIFSVVNALLLRPLPYAHPRELVSIGGGSGGEFLGLRERLRSFQQVAAFVPRQLSIDDGTSASRVEGASITPDLFRTLGVAPRLGHDFTDDNGVAGRNDVVIISHLLWQRQFGGSGTAIDRTLLVDGIPHRIIGVMPSDFHYPASGTQYWLPIVFNPANAGSHWGIGNGQFIGRVRPGVPMRQAVKEVRDVWPTLRRLNPLWDPGEQYARNVHPRPLQDTMIGAPTSLLWVLIGCVMLVLLIACVNVANLLLARATARERELAVRAAVGGGRGRLIRQLVTESIVLATIGATLGVGLAFGLLRGLVSILPPGIPRIDEISIDGTILGGTAVIAIFTGIAFGLVPAIRATAAGESRLGIAGRRSTHGAQHHRLAGSLVAAEVALAVLLVIGAQLLAKSFRELRRVDTGFSTSHLVVARVSPPSGAFRDPARVTAFYTGVLERLAATPGVEQAAAVDKLPIAGPVWGIAPRIEGQYEDGSKPLPDVHHHQAVSAGYFRAMGIPVLEGRPIDRTDGPDAAPVAVVSASMAKRFWPGQSAIGKRVGYPWPSPWLTIVGVVPDVRQDSLRDTLGMTLYVPWQQRTRMSGSEMWLVVRTLGDTRTMTTTIPAIVHDADRSVPVSEVRTMDDIIDASMQRDRFATIMVTLFAVAAMLLGAVGIYGVMSYLVSQRTQELGVRIALGASRTNVLSLVVGRGLSLAVIGAVAGVIASVWATRPLMPLLYGVATNDLTTLLTVPVFFLVVALIASYGPARRATRVDCVTSLRAE